MSRKHIINNYEIGALIRRRRLELLITQEKLACILDITYQQIQRYEQGKSNINLQNIQIIADALSVPVSYFFDQENYSNGNSKLSDDELELVGNYRKVANTDIKKFLTKVVSLARNQS